MKNKEPRNKLTKAEYFEFQFHIKKMQANEKETEIDKLKLEIMARDMEIMRLKMLNKKNDLNDKINTQSLLRKDYDTFKLNLENNLNRSLNDTAISEETYEINVLETKKP